jgi:hypothetical protein
MTRLGQGFGAAGEACLIDVEYLSSNFSVLWRV